MPDATNSGFSHGHAAGSRISQNPVPSANSPENPFFNAREAELNGFQCCLSVRGGGERLDFGRLVW